MEHRFHYREISRNVSLNNQRMSIQSSSLISSVLLYLKCWSKNNCFVIVESRKKQTRLACETSHLEKIFSKILFRNSTPLIIESNILKTSMIQICEKSLFKLHVVMYILSVLGSADMLLFTSWHGSVYFPSSCCLALKRSCSTQNWCSTVNTKF